MHINVDLVVSQKSGALTSIGFLGFLLLPPVSSYHEAFPALEGWSFWDRPYYTRQRKGPHCPLIETSWQAVFETCQGMMCAVYLFSRLSCMPGVLNNNFFIDVWWFPTISYVKIWFIIQYRFQWMAIRSQVFFSVKIPEPALLYQQFMLGCRLLLPSRISKQTHVLLLICLWRHPADFRFQTPWNLLNRLFVWRFFRFGKTLRFWYLLCHGLYSWAVVKTSGTHGNEYKSSLQLVEYESLDRSAGMEWPRLSWRWFSWYLRIDGS